MKQHLRYPMHYAIAALIALAVHFAIGYGIATNTGIHNTLLACGDSYSNILCFFSTGIITLGGILFISLPLAMLSGALYLRLAKFSLHTILVLPLAAHTIMLTGLYTFWQFTRIIPPLPIICLVFIVTYIAVGLALKEQSPPKPHTIQ